MCGILSWLSLSARLQSGKDSLPGLLSVLYLGLCPPPSFVGFLDLPAERALSISLWIPSKCEEMFISCPR